MVLTRDGSTADSRGTQVLWLKLGAWLLGLAPGARILQRAWQGDLGTNPVEELLLRTGDWAIIMLLVALAVTPLRKITKWNALAKLRRLMGLFAFTYITAHFMVYLLIDQGLAFELSAIEFVWEDIAERPFITVGFTAWVLLVPLAITSTRGWIRRLGRRWQILHRLVYVAGVLGVVHFYWKVKADTRLPLVAAAVLLALFLIRVPEWKRKRERRRAQKGPSKVSSDARTPAGTAAEPPAS